MTAAPRSGKRAPARPFARVLLSLLAAVLLCLPFGAAWQYHAYRQAVARQESVPEPAPEAGKNPGGPAAAPARQPRPNGPVVLAYHDVRPHGHSPYTVSPEAFDAQLTALADAGYSTLTSAEFTRYLRGGRVPARSVYLTFDDGAQGLWQYADPLLAGHRMRAAAFLITGQVGRRHSYYLSWDEIRRMAESGRWDFQGHTHDSHHRAPVDAAGHRGSALTNRLWLPGAGRRETPAEYRRRVVRDLDRSVAEITGHGLPRPTVFAYPFSETAEDSNLRPGEPSPQRLLRQRFAVTLTNATGGALPPGPRAAAAGRVQRLEVTARTGVRELMDGVAEWTPVAPGAVPRPLRDPARWRLRGDLAAAGGVRPGSLSGRGPLPARRGCLAADYRSVGSADWTDYTVGATAAGLRGTGNHTVLTVRKGSRHPLTVHLSRDRVRVATGSPVRLRTVAERELAPARRHRLRVLVSPARTVVRVDGGTRITVRTAAGTPAARTAGGIALGICTTGARTPWPHFAALTLADRQPATAPGGGR
ncbi:polysaccharide deacetylase family protein [Streptomyces sp. CA-132043]|uniref:polysaccharide deacetylase family protein n=1 Tax=Streptomyces sp. CA-132043 TaxID=3240048 RepID=UPI003D8E5B9C